MCGQCYAQVVLLPWKTRYPLTNTLDGSHAWSGRVWKIPVPTGIRNHDSPTRNEPLCRLSYPGSCVQAPYCIHHSLVTASKWYIVLLPHSIFQTYCTGPPKLKFLSPRCNCTTHNKLLNISRGTIYVISPPATNFYIYPCTNDYILSKLKENKEHVETI